MELQRARRGDCRELKNLYIEAFPAEERAPFWLLTRRARQGRGDFWVLREEGRFAGFGYVICHADMAYVFYLAVVKEMRGRGLGTQTVRALIRAYEGKRLYLALERLDGTADNYAQRLARHAFYERCGLKDLPYCIKEADVVYAIMGEGGAVQPDEYKAMMNAFQGLLRRLVDMRIVEHE